MTFAYDKAALREIVLQYALKFGQFTLASGKQASYYLDCRTITLHPKGANHIAAGMLDVIASGAFGSMPDAVGGLAIGADPITASIVVHAVYEICLCWALWSAKNPNNTAQAS